MSGVSVNIPAHYPNRLRSSMICLCPSCTKVGINISRSEIQNTPEELCHTIQLRYTSDGNFQLNQFWKCSGDEQPANDIELWGGCGVFPDEQILQAFLRNVAESTEVSTVCLCFFPGVSFQSRNLSARSYKLLTVKTSPSLKT